MFNPEDEKEITQRLSAVTNPVKIILFTSSLNCETCPDTETLLKEFANLSDQIQLETYNLYVDREKAEQYKIDKVPAIILEGDHDYGIRYFGIPGGYEFATLLDDVISIGKRDSGLSESSKEKIQALTEPLNLKVFVTPG